MELHHLNVKTRKLGRKGAARKLRAQGMIPANLYGGDKDNLHIALSESDFIHYLHEAGSETSVVQLDVEDVPGESTAAMVREVQHDPIHDDLLHADFLRIRLDQEIVVSVPITFVGTPEGVKEGGVADYQLREVEVECTALEVPEEVTLDISGVGMNETLHASDLSIPGDKVTMVTEPERAVMTVVPPRAIIEETEEEEEALEPEIIGEAPEEGEEEEAEGEG
jgi:large subunit ribosomal protein L25